MMKTVKKIPELRFPEFEGEWQLYEIQELFDLVSGQHLNPDEYTNENTNGLVPYFTGPSDFTNDESKLMKWALNSGKQANVNDILITVKGNGVGALMLLKLDKVVIGRQLMAIREKSGLNEFLVCVFEKRKQYFEALASGNLIPGLSRNDILKTKEFFPSLPEQQKIASFLSSADQRIQLLTQKKEKLEQYKKGIMQQIFSQQLRFKDENGKDYPDWEEKRLGDVGKTISGLTYNPNDIVENGTLVLRSSNIKNRELNFTDNVFVDVSKFNPVKESDILICVRNGSRNLIGKNALIKKEHENFAFGAFMSIYRSKHNKFIFQFLDTDSYYKNVYKNLGATINSINNSDLAQFKIPFPCKQEQQKIASFLSSLDEKISLVNQQIELTRKWKQGLLQKMFV